MATVRTIVLLVIAMLLSSASIVCGCANNRVALVPGAAHIDAMDRAFAGAIPYESGDYPALETPSGRLRIGKVDVGHSGVGVILREGRPHCTATVIDKSVLLTAAHCLDQVDLKQLEFATGPDAWSPSRKYPLASTRIHPGFKRNPMHDDIAIAFLRNPIEDPDVVLIRVPESRTQAKTWVDPGHDLTFVGYGYAVTRIGDRYRLGTKARVEIPVRAIEDKVFKYGERDKNTCVGDSGGPALALNRDGKATVVGVTSAGDAGCTESAESTRVDAYLPWIKAVAGIPREASNLELTDSAALSESKDVRNRQEGLVALADFVRKHAPWRPQTGTTPISKDAEMAIKAIARADKTGITEPIRLSNIDIHGVDLTQAHLEGALMWGSNLRGVVFAGAHLNGANFAGSDFDGGSLEDADLSGAILDPSCPCAPQRVTTFNETRMARAILSNAILIAADLRRAKGLTREQVLSAKSRIHAQLAEHLGVRPEGGPWPGCGEKATVCP